MPTNTNLFLAMTEPSEFGLVITGFLFVVAMLSVLAVATYLGGRFFAKRDERAQSHQADRLQPDSAGSIIQNAEVETEIAAVLSAAIHVVLQEREFRVRAIREVTSG